MINPILDHSLHFSNVRNQGKRPTCLAFAISDLNAHHNSTKELSVEYLCHYSAIKTTGWSGEGFAVDVMLEAASKQGQPLEHLYPYNSIELLTPLTIPPTGLAPIYKAGFTENSLKFDDIVKELDKGKIIGIALCVTKTLFTPIDGIVQHDINALLDTYHALTVTGHGVHKTNSEKYFKVRNSWGDSWGDKGYAWLPKSLIDLHLVGTFTT